MTTLNTPASKTSSTKDTPVSKGLSSFTLKIIAIIGMTCNHAGYIFYSQFPFEITFVCFAIGGVTFPTMAFLLVEGYKHTSNIRKYAMRLFVFALISQIPFSLFLAGLEANVLFTLLLGLLAIYLFDNMQNRILFWLAFVGIVAISSLCDWGMLGPVVILILHAVPHNKERIIFAIGLIILSVGFPSLLAYFATLDLIQLPFALYAFVGSGLCIPLLLAYNGSRGKPLKWFFYAYYPCHILVLGLAKGFIFGDWTLAL
ncbi:TraX family protein [Eggerthellaceae bacterium 3-80]|nr:conjugal transfer protein TraX [bacterium D16-34]